MSDDNGSNGTNDTSDTNKIGATIVYDSPHALAAAKEYQKKIAGQLGFKLASRPYNPDEQKRNELLVRLTEATQGKASLPKGGGVSGIKTDPFLTKRGPDYSGWHRQNPVNMSGDLDDDAWVRGAYQSLLGRDADQGGLDYWKANLASGASRDSVIANMKRAPEYRDKFIGEAYKNLLGRDVGLEGIDYWSKAMEGGASEDSIITSIKRSPEYGQLQQKLMTDAIAAKTPLEVLNESYDDQIATVGRDLVKAQDRVQGKYGTAEDYSPLLTTSDLIYTQDPEADSVASVNYLASVDPSDSSPSIWTKALADAGKKALANVNVSNLVDDFVNAYLS